MPLFKIGYGEVLEPLERRENEEEEFIWKKISMGIEKEENIEM